MSEPDPEDLAEAVRAFEREQRDNDIREEAEILDEIVETIAKGSD